MTKKDYIKFAVMFNVYKDMPSADTLWNALVEYSANIFSDDNSNFDKQRFYAACGYKED